MLTGSAGWGSQSAWRRQARWVAVCEFISWNRFRKIICSVLQPTSVSKKESHVGWVTFCASRQLVGIGGLWWALEGTTSQAAQLSNLDGQQAATHFNLPTIGIVSSILCLLFSTIWLDESNSFFLQSVKKHQNMFTLITKQTIIGFKQMNE